MMVAIVNLILFIVGLACLVLWVVSLVKWDGKYHCDKNECDTCPFPCKEHDKERNRYDYSGKD